MAACAASLLPFAGRCGLRDYMYMSGSSSVALCARNARITVYDVTTWSWVNLVNPLYEPQRSLWSAFMKNGTVNFAGKYR